MHAKQALHYSLSFLTLLGAVHGTTLLHVPECTVKAWVRAPDLAPNTVVQGDARVKISPGCPAVESVTLGLRLKERSFVKALRSDEDRKRIQAGMHATRPFVPNPLTSSPLDWPPSRCGSDEVALHEMFADKDLWVIREEEQVVFETTQQVLLADGITQYHDVVQDFAVLVPSTNFPPALELSNTGSVLDWNQLEIFNMEYIYEYFFRVPLTNGTSTEISAGVTSFQPLYNPNLYTKLRSKDMEADLKRVHFPEREDFLTTNYTVRITDILDSVFVQGSRSQATVIVTRTGPARTFTTPLKIHGCVEPDILSKWAVEHNPAGSNDWMIHRPERILHSVPQDIKGDSPRMVHVPGRTLPCLFRRDNVVSVMMPNSTADEVRSGDIVTTTSEAISIPITVDRRHIPDFETHYQTLASALRIVVETPREKNDDVDPDDPSTQLKDQNLRMFEDDEEKWVPWEKKGMPPAPTVWHRYSGTIPVVVRPTEEATSSPGCLQANAVSDMRGQLVMSEETGCVRQQLMHYLDEGARGPIFVGSSVLNEVLAEDPVEREWRAPILQPVVSSPPEGEELVYRYYTPFLTHQLIYVGETWAKKVAHKQSPGLQLLLTDQVSVF